VAPENGAAGSAAGDAVGRRDLVIVLPSADRLAPAERDRIRMLVGRALDEVVVLGPRPELLEPSSADAMLDVVEIAVRRAETVCVLGRDADAAVSAALTLYPSRTRCLLGGDVDLEAVGRALGSAARAVARDGTVVVLDGGDGMLDRRWTAGVLAGAAAGGVSEIASEAQHVVSTGPELLQLLDDQQAAVAAGLAPGRTGPGPGAGPGSGTGTGPGDTASIDEFLLEEDVPVALALPPVQVVVLDASVEAAVVLVELLERGLRVIAPRSLLLDLTDHPGVVLRWRVRWDVAFEALLRQVLSGDPPAGGVPLPPADVLVLEPGPAAPVG